jgi:hypothetical protein
MRLTTQRRRKPKRQKDNEKGSDICVRVYTDGRIQEKGRKPTQHIGKNQWFKCVGCYQDEEQNIQVKQETQKNELYPVVKHEENKISPSNPFFPKISSLWQFLKLLLVWQLFKKIPPSRTRKILYLWRYVYNRPRLTGKLTLIWTKLMNIQKIIF